MLLSRLANSTVSKPQPAHYKPHSDPSPLVAYTLHALPKVIPTTTSCNCRACQDQEKKLKQVSAGKGRRSIHLLPQILRHSRISELHLLIALVYISRLSAKLPKSAIGSQDTAVRMLIAALMIASKYTNDSISPLRPKHFVQMTSTYSIPEVTKMERDFLKVVDFNLSVTEDELIRFWEEQIGKPGGGRVELKTLSRKPVAL